MLKETETEETIGFNVTFLSLVAFQLEGAGAPWAPLATAMGTSSCQEGHGLFLILR